VASSAAADQSVSHLSCLSVKLNTELSAKRGTVGEELTSGTVDGPLSKYRKPGD